MAFFDKARFEADRQLRIMRLNMTISGLRKQLAAAKEQIAAQALELYRAGKLGDTELASFLQQAIELEKQIAQKEAEIEAIKSEPVPVSVPTPVPVPAKQPATYGHLCSRERTPLPAEALFCPTCGAPAIDVPPPEATAEPSPPTGEPTCSSCGKAVPPEAIFCPHCGTRLQ